MRKEPTPKQVLVSHVLNCHHRVTVDRRSFKEISKAHANDHWRSRGFLNHYHKGNSGPNDRPLGWYTGRDVVQRKEGYNEG